MYNILPNTLFTGKNIVFLPTCHSTNDIAAEMLVKNEVVEGTTIVTAAQTAGRGQRGNKWEAEPNKNLTFSLILKPHFLLATEQFSLNMAVSLSVYEFLCLYLPVENVKIKWPNDLYYKDKKIGGILIENGVKKYHLENTIVGIGLNINQENFGENRAISLKNITGIDLNLEDCLKKLLELLEKYYLKIREKSGSNLKEMYLKTIFRFNEPHPYQTENGDFFQGKIIDIDELGRLCVNMPDGKIQAFAFKEIVFL